MESLSEVALEGRDMWHANNCQTCHQLYGFGGFLGPDLTNVAGRADRARFDSILTEGSLQMPAFHFSEGEIDALVAYFETLNKTGLGQAGVPRMPLPAAIGTAIGTVAAEEPMPEAARLGDELFNSGACIGCHRVLYSNDLGVASAPDLSTVTQRLGDDEIHTVLENGRGLLMPPSGLDEQQRGQVIAWMHWLSEHRDAIELELGAPERPDSLPWFEFGSPKTASEDPR